MISKLRKSTKDSLRSTLTDKKLSKKVIVMGSIAGTLVAATPFLFYLYTFVPNEQIWTTSLFTYRSGYYESAQIGVWSIMGKLVPLLLLLIWFFTCRHWWYHAILVPVAMYAYQLAGVIADESLHFDEFKLIYLVPLMAIIIPSIYLIRAQMMDKLNDAGKTMEELEAEFMIKPTTFWGKVRQYF
jgi:hypothetical protein